MSNLFQNYNRWNLEIDSGEGAKVKDTNGNEYLDFTSGIGVTNLGHNHPKVKAALQQQLDKVWHVSNLFEIELQERVASRLTKHSSGDAVLFCNSGAEANEAAIKLARKHTGKHKIITFEQSFHGRTMATLSATGQEKVKHGFGPQLETFVHVPYNDIDALSKEMDVHTAAVMIEIVQGEGGVNPGNEQFIQKVEELCREYGVLLIVDEVQTGIGRTGKPFAYQHHNISPDIITSAKGLGNGFPVGAMISKQALIESFGPGTHGTTFGGNPLAMATADAVLEIVFDEGFLDDVSKKGDYLLSSLEKELGGCSFVENIRGKGMMIGIACTGEVTSLLPSLRQKGLLILVAGQKVIRLLPPLIVSKQEIDKAVGLLANEIRTKAEAAKV